MPSDPLGNTPTVSPSTITIGQSATITIYSVSSNATYQYKYQIVEGNTVLNEDTISSQNKTYTYTPSTTGVHTLQIKWYGRTYQPKTNTYSNWTYLNETYNRNDTLEITVNSIIIASGTVNVVDGEAVLNVSTPISIGTYTITGDYLQNSHYQSGTDTGTLTISKGTPTITLTSSNQEITLNNTATFTITVTYKNNALTEGTCTFYEDNTAVLFNQALNNNGQCVLSYTPNTTGTHTYKAVYNGTSNYNQSQSQNTSINVIPNVTTELPVDVTTSNATAEAVVVDDNNSRLMLFNVEGTFTTTTNNQTTCYIECDGMFSQLNTTIPCSLFIYNKTEGWTLILHEETGMSYQVPSEIYQQQMVSFYDAAFTVSFDTTLNEYSLQMDITDLVNQGTLVDLNVDENGQITDEILIGLYNHGANEDTYIEIYNSLVVTGHFTEISIDDYSNDVMFDETSGTLSAVIQNDVPSVEASDDLYGCIQSELDASWISQNYDGVLVCVVNEEGSRGFVLMYQIGMSGINGLSSSASVYLQEIDDLVNSMYNGMWGDFLSVGGSDSLQGDEDITFVYEIYDGEITLIFAHESLMTSDPDYFGWWLALDDGEGNYMSVESPNFYDLITNNW